MLCGKVVVRSCAPPKHHEFAEVVEDLIVFVHPTIVERHRTTVLHHHLEIFTRAARAGGVRRIRCMWWWWQLPCSATFVHVGRIRARCRRSSIVAIIWFRIGHLSRALSFTTSFIHCRTVSKHRGFEGQVVGALVAPRLALPHDDPVLHVAEFAPMLCQLVRSMPLEVPFRIGLRACIVADQAFELACVMVAAFNARDFTVGDWEFRVLERSLHEGAFQPSLGNAVGLL